LDVPWKAAFLMVLHSKVVSTHRGRGLAGVMCRFKGIDENPSLRPWKGWAGKGREGGGTDLGHES